MAQQVLQPHIAAMIGEAFLRGSSLSQLQAVPGVPGVAATSNVLHVILRQMDFLVN